MENLFWILFSFLCGSIPFSVLLSKIFLRTDVRQFGDGNPGATNVYKAGSPALGIITLILDVTKSALPIGICYSNLGIRGLPMVLIALAPLVGSMFSPFLDFKGGKSLAVALGIWIGLTTWQVSVPAVVGILIGTLMLSSTGWGMMVSMGVILITLLIWIQQPLLIWIWLGITTLLAWTHRHDLRTPPRLHPRINRFYRGLNRREDP
jgi:glycerol-3-phosphate acyltransferase PlsY